MAIERHSTGEEEKVVSTLKKCLQPFASSMRKGSVEKVHAKQFRKPSLVQEA